ncbi:MAG: glycosyl transferase [Cyanobacteria bacterium P01_H01_bin.121]
MPRPTLYVAITSHGFGHATRTCAVVAEIQRRLPDLLVILVTQAPYWLLDSYLEHAFIHRPRAYDIGVIQPDGLTLDQAATLQQLQAIQQRQNQIIAGEVSFIQQNEVQLVLADLPPLAARIAQAAGIPCWMMGNFGWDFIYKPWGPDFAAVTAWIESCFNQCDRLFRLPFHEPMAAFPQITDVGLTGGNPKYSVTELRAKLPLQQPPERTVMLSFGGLGIAELPYENCAQFPDWQFIQFGSQGPDLPNLLKLTDRHYRPVDLMPVCGAIVSKPGYGTFAEACRMGVPIITVTREHFAEAPLLLAGLKQIAHHRVITPQDLQQSGWEFLKDPLEAPTDPGAIGHDGNSEIAQAVVDYYRTHVSP